MLRHTFLHLPGIGKTKERQLWDSGITTLDEFERRFLSQISLFPETGNDALFLAVTESLTALATGDTDFFAQRLPPSEHYRIALHDPKRTIFLDIETTGLSVYYDDTTVIGTSDFQGYRAHIRGGDLSPVAQKLRDATCLVTFNGTLFDLKFLRKEFPDLHLPKAHIDLRFFGRPVGLKGTQKQIERMLQLTRPDEIRDVIGETAPILWYRYSLGDPDAARKLVEYNFSDVEGMKLILDTALTRYRLRDPRQFRFIEMPTFFQGTRPLSWASSKNSQRRGRVFIPPYRGKVGPKIRYEELITDSKSKRLRVVGIDLTGSEKRPTGWCLLSGATADTKLVRTDKELIAETAAARPDLVSIDSPLSMPVGRRSVYDTDPGRQKYGITRECERILKKRGVNVYPCLINSMQNLTARGTRLAKKLRSLGIPVIESYPGAAQDIIGIPRKRAGLDHLKRGLAAFGIKGDFNDAKVTHDEVDAITSAVVGLFFWSGNFEALGNDTEDYLIVPNLQAIPDTWRARLVVGFSGPIASGKTTGANFLKTQRFAYTRYSQVLEELLKEKGQKVSRDTLQAYGEQVHRKPGQRWLSQQLVRRLPTDANLVIDGLRFPEDHAYLVECFGPAFVHVHIVAAPEVRRARYIADGHTSDEFERASEHPVEAKIPLLKILSKRPLRNEGEKQAFYNEILKQFAHTNSSTTESAKIS